MSDKSSTALMILRAWIEPGSAKPLRVHLRSNLAVSKPFEKEQSFADADAVTKQVEEWLAEIVSAAATD